MEKKKSNKSMKSTRYLVLGGISVLMIAIFIIIAPSFFSVSTAMNVLRQTSSLAICAIGMTMIILTGGIDLSVGAVIAFSGAVGAIAMQAVGGTGLNVALIGIICTVGSAMIFGAINGILIGVFQVSPFMATLATMAVARGITLKITSSSRVMVKEPIYNFFGQKELFKIGSAGVPSVLLLMAVFYVIAFFILSRTTFGRRTYAAGGNAVTARASGIPVKKHVFWVYIMASVTYGFAAIVTVGRAMSAQPLAGTGFEFEVITAVVIGGISMTGGIGSLGGTLLGAMLVGVISTGLGMVDVPPFINYVVKGILIFAAVILDMYIGKLNVSRVTKSENADKKDAQKEAAEKEIHANNSSALNLIESSKQSVLALEHIVKTFPGVRALDDVSLEIKRGKVHALVGENGAGKSTLMKILSGVYQKDGGVVTIDGIPVEMNSPIDSKKLGISVIYQELALVPELSVTRNIFIGKEILNKTRILIDMRKMTARAKELIGRFGLNINVNKRTGNYTVGQMQMIEIAKAIESNAWLVVMDEPTASITEADKNKLFDIIRELKAQGMAVVYISHRMSEIFEIADEITVLRDGKNVITQNIEDVNESDLIKYMVGRELNDIFTREKTASDENPVILEVKDLYRKGVFEPISFKVRGGEVLGLSGLIGAGRTEIMRCLFGLDKPDGGEIYLDGEKLEVHDPIDAIRAGVCLVSEDRRREGIVPFMSVRENISLPSLPWISKASVVDRNADMEMCNKYIDALRIKTPTPEQQIGNLSGGNQQKCCVAKWLARNPRVIIMDEPTRGIDIGAKAEMHKLIDQLTKENIAIIMISSELPEIIGASDRIITLYEGKVTGRFNQKETEVTQEMLLTSAAGVARESA